MNHQEGDGFLLEGSVLKLKGGGEGLKPRLPGPAGGPEPRLGGPKPGFTTVALCVPASVCVHDCRRARRRFQATFSSISSPTPPTDGYFNSEEDASFQTEGWVFVPPYTRPGHLFTPTPHRGRGGGFYCRTHSN